MRVDTHESAEHTAMSEQRRDEQIQAVERAKRRMLDWANPVEYVNNMYGCHPDNDDTDYFKVVFAGE
jgi:hypothetical protein